MKVIVPIIAIASLSTEVAAHSGQRKHFRQNVDTVLTKPVAKPLRSQYKGVGLRGLKEENKNSDEKDDGGKDERESNEKPKDDEKKVDDKKKDDEKAKEEEKFKADDKSKDGEKSKDEEKSKYDDEKSKDDKKPKDDEAKPAKDDETSKVDTEEKTKKAPKEAPLYECFDFSDLVFLDGCTCDELESSCDEIIAAEEEKAALKEAREAEKAANGRYLQSEEEEKPAKKWEVACSAIETCCRSDVSLDRFQSCMSSEIGNVYIGPKEAEGVTADVVDAVAPAGEVGDFEGEPDEEFEFEELMSMQTLVPPASMSMDMDVDYYGGGSDDSKRRRRLVFGA